MRRLHKLKFLIDTSAFSGISFFCNNPKAFISPLAFLYIYVGLIVLIIDANKCAILI